MPALLTGERSGTGVDTMLHFRVARAGADRLNLRAEPSRSAAILDRLADGTLVEPLGPAREAGGLTWVHVQVSGGAAGWVASDFLDIVAAVPARPAVPVSPVPTPQAEPAGPAESPSERYRVNASGVRLRERPGTGPDVTILTTMRDGTIVDDDGARTVNADGLEWRRVRVNGQTGWVATSFLVPDDGIVDTGSAGGTHHQFDASTPTELQVQDWTCSIRSTMWLLKSIGVGVTPAEAQDTMSPRYVNSDVGLLDATGSGLVEVLHDQWGIQAFNRAPVSFEEVAGWAGTRPVAIGGRNWGHWTAVRGFDGERLVLANPGGTGPRFGQQTLSRQQFADLGWFSAVVIPVD
jgi:uncharacterized protein YraI